MAVGPHVVDGIPTVGRVLGRPLQIIHHEEVQQAVVVIIEPAAGDPPNATLDSRLSGDIFKSSVSQARVEMIGIHSGYEQVDVSIAIEDCCRRSDALPCTWQPG